MLATNICAGEFLDKSNIALNTVHGGFRKERLGEVKALLKEEEIDSEQKFDAIKETLNILCGNLLPEIAGNQDIFNIKTFFV